MMPVSLQITYRKGRPFAAWIHLDRKPSEKSARTEPITNDLLVDFASDGRALGIEIVNPAATSLDDLYTVFDRLGLGRPSEADLAPLRAA